MHEIIRFDNVSKYFDKVRALDSLSFAVGPSRIVGLVGTNGSGKSTLLRHIAGIYVPTRGECFTLGVPARSLGAGEFARIGMVHQHENFLTWMNVSEILSYVGGFYPKWDKNMQHRLADYFELQPDAKIQNLSPGKKQRLAILLATCHHPELIVLDEPLSDLDPLAREKILQLLLDVFRDDGPTILISSHLLHDIERIVDHIMCLDEGKLLMDESLDSVHERFAEWSVSAGGANLPEHFSEPWIISQNGNGLQRVLVVNDSEKQLARFRTKYSAQVDARPINLEKIFNHVVGDLHDRDMNFRRENLEHQPSQRVFR